MSAASSRTRALRLICGAAGATLLVGSLVACSAEPADTAAPGDTTVEETTAPGPVEVTSNVSDSAPVTVDKFVEVTATGGTLTKVSVDPAEGEAVPGKVNTAGTSWLATARLEPGTTYTITAATVNSGGSAATDTSTFTTEDLALAEQTYASIAPLDGETVGVGMPVVVNFDIAVENRAEFEKHMTITSTPTQQGTWHWASDSQVHYRPAKYWQTGTDVTVDLDINALPAGNGIYGQDSRKISFHVGDEVISKVDSKSHQMKSYINGELVKTMPITTGKDGFITRSGVKVVMQKFRTKRMNSETIGIPANSAEGYDLDNVEYALRVTSSGEFLHAAPWSVGSQGHANVSHGCTGMSTADAKWFYEHSNRGDVVEFTGTDRPMTLYNGYGDWNASFADYSEGSAL